MVVLFYNTWATVTLSEDHFWQAKGPTWYRKHARNTPEKTMGGWPKMIISKVHDLCRGIWIHENSIPRQEHRRALARANRRRARRGAPIAVAGWSSEVRSTSRFQTAQCMLDVSWCFLCRLLTPNFYAFVLGCDAKMVEQCKKMVCSLTGNGQCWFFGTWMTFGWGYIQYGWTVFVFVSIWCCRLSLLYKHSKKCLQSPRILFTHAVCVCVQISRMMLLLQFMWVLAVLLGCQYCLFYPLLCFVIWCLASLFGHVWCVKAQKKTAHRHHDVWTLQYSPAVAMPQKQAYNRLLKQRDVLFSPLKKRQTIRCSEADCCWRLSVKRVTISAAGLIPSSMIQLGRLKLRVQMVELHQFGERKNCCDLGGSGARGDLRQRCTRWAPTNPTSDK